MPMRTMVAKIMAATSFREVYLGGGRVRKMFVGKKANVAGEGVERGWLNVLRNAF